MFHTKEGLNDDSVEEKGNMREKRREKMETL